MIDWPEHKKWLWAARFVLVIATLFAVLNASDVRVSAAYLIAAVMYATSAVLKALIHSKAQPTNTNETR